MEDKEYYSPRRLRKVITLYNFLKNNSISHLFTALEISNNLTDELKRLKEIYETDLLVFTDENYKELDNALSELFRILQKEKLQ